MNNFNPIKLQHQIKNNTTNVTDYFKDLKDWQKSMDLKDYETQSKNLKQRIEHVYTYEQKG